MPTRSRIAGAILAALLLAQGVLPVPALSLPQSRDTKAAYRTLDAGLQGLREDFNNDAAQVRIVMLLSPT